MYSYEISTTAQSHKQFQEWGVQNAFPKFFVSIKCYKENVNKENETKEKILLIEGEFEINGHYYCSGSSNYDFEKINIIKLSFNPEKIKKIDRINLLGNKSDLLKNIEKCLNPTMIYKCSDNILGVIADRI